MHTFIILIAVVGLLALGYIWSELNELYIGRANIFTTIRQTLHR